MYISQFVKDGLNVDFRNSPMANVDIKFLSDYCNNYLKSVKLNYKIDKSNSIYGYARGMCVGMFTDFFLLILIGGLCYADINILFIFMMYLFLIILFYKRAKHYNMQRVRNVYMLYLTVRKGLRYKK